MHQNKWVERIRDSFSSLSGSDQVEAMNRKEAIWNNVNPEPKKKSKSYLWLIFLIPLLFFLASKFKKQVERAAKEPSPVEQNEVKPLLADSQSIELDQIKSKLDYRGKQIDSLLKANIALKAEIEKQKSKAIVVNASTETQFITDTIFLTEIKVQEKILEKIIRDTILIEVPSSIVLEPTLAVSNKPILELSAQASLEVENSSLPTSIKFNFARVNQKDK